MLTPARTTVALVLLLIAAPTRAADLIVEGKGFAALAYTDVTALVNPVEGGAFVVLDVTLPIEGNPRRGNLWLRLESFEGSALTPGIYMDLGCASREGTPVDPEFRRNLCATGAFEVFEVSYDASGGIARLLLSFESLGLIDFDELGGVVDYRSEPRPAEGATDGRELDPSPAFLRGSLEIDFIGTSGPAHSQAGITSRAGIPPTARPTSQVFDPRAARRSAPATEAPVIQEDVEPAPAPATTPATVSPEPPVAEARPARSFLFKGFRPGCCGTDPGSPQPRPESEVRPRPPATASGAVPAPERTIELIERAAPEAVPEESVWAGLAERGPPREAASRQDVDTTPDASAAPEFRPDSRRRIEGRAGVDWLWNMLMGLLDLARSYLP